MGATGRVLGAWVASGFGIVACSQPPSHLVSGASAASSSARSPAVIVADGVVPAAAPEVEVAPPLPPLRGDAWVEALPRKALVAPPLGAMSPRPLVVAVHGAEDRPEWECAAWRAVFAEFAFIACPTGSPLRTGYVFGSVEQIAKETDAVVANVRAKYGAYVADGPPVVVSFSFGATLASSFVATRPGVYSALFLAEAGHTSIDPAGVARDVVRAGITRVAIGCSTGPCMTWAADERRALERVGIHALYANAGNIGHFIDEKIARAYARTLPGLLGDDPRFAGLGEATTARYIAIDSGERGW